MSILTLKFVYPNISRYIFSLKLCYANNEIFRYTYVIYLTKSNDKFEGSTELVSWLKCCKYSSTKPPKNEKKTKTEIVINNKMYLYQIKIYM